MLVRAWRMTPEINPVNVFQLLSSTPDRATLYYESLARATDGTEGDYAISGGQMGRDKNHEVAPRTMIGGVTLHLACIAFTEIAGWGTAGRIQVPSRTVRRGRTVTGLDIRGGELRVRARARNGLHLARWQRITALMQYEDPRCFYGHATNVNYLYAGLPSLDDALGYASMANRSASGEARNTGFVDWTVGFDPDEWEPIDARPDKVAAWTYSRSTTTAEAMREKLLNIMIVFSAFVPLTPEPTAKPDATFGNLDLSKVELWVDDALNPNMTVV